MMRRRDIPPLARSLFRLLALCLLTATASAETLRVVATFSLLADMTQVIGGNRVEVHTLVGANSDAHAWQPTPADSRALSKARVVVANGLGFEGWIDRLIDSSGFHGTLVIASRGVKTLLLDDNAIDPHAWHDLANAPIYVDTIAAALSLADPPGKSLYHANASRYKAEIAALDREIRRMLDAIPAARRKAVSPHNAFAYFARAYGIDCIPLLNASEADPSAREIRRIIQLIRAENIPVIFMENGVSPQLVKRISAESGARIGGTLYSDSLSGKDGPAGSYLDLMRHNASMFSRLMAE